MINFPQRNWTDYGGEVMVGQGMARIDAIRQVQIPVPLPLCLCLVVSLASPSNSLHWSNLSKRKMGMMRQEYAIFLSNNKGAFSMQRIEYKNLGNRAKENYNFAKVASRLADYGYSCIRLTCPI